MLLIVLLVSPAKNGHNEAAPRKVHPQVRSWFYLLSFTHSISVAWQQLQLLGNDAGLCEPSQLESNPRPHNSPASPQPPTSRSCTKKNLGGHRAQLRHGYLPTCQKTPNQIPTKAGCLEERRLNPARQMHLFQELSLSKSLL